MKNNYSDLSLAMPKIWLSSGEIADDALSTECDCVCDACFDPARVALERSSLAQITARIRTGSVTQVTPEENLYQETLNNYRMVLSAAGQRMVVVDAPSAHLLLPTSTTSVEELRQRAGRWSEDVFSEALALLLSQGILVSPGLSPPEDPPRLVRHTLSAWLGLTNRCNLNCLYCYVPHGRQDMPPDTARRSVQAIFRSAQKHGYPNIKIKYSGGEPTLNFASLRAAHQEAKMLAQQTGLGLKSVMLTNGFHINVEQVNYLLDGAIAVMVSLDGTAKTHNQNRPVLGSRNGSYDYVLENIERLVACGIRPHISITITRHNLFDVPTLVEQLLHSQLTFSLNLYRQAIPGSKDDPLMCSNAELIEGMAQIYRVIERSLPSYSLWRGLCDRADPASPHVLPCAAGQHYLVINPRGELSGCQMESASSNVDIDDSDPLIHLNKSLNSYSSDLTNYTLCASCIWRYRCAGGCPRMALAEENPAGYRSPLCEIYRHILPAAARLEAQRLIRYQPQWRI